MLTNSYEGELSRRFEELDAKKKYKLQMKKVSNIKLKSRKK